MNLRDAIAQSPKHTATAMFGGEIRWWIFQEPKVRNRPEFPIIVERAIGGDPVSSRSTYATWDAFWCAHPTGEIETADWQPYNPPAGLGD